MSRTSTTLRSAVLLVTALAVLAPALPAYAAAPPAAPTTLTSSVGDRYLDLSWSGGGGTGAVVRDVTGQPSPYTTTSGRGVTPATATTARDTGFTNRVTATYAVWSLDTDGTPSDTPLVQDVARAPLVSTALTLSISTGTVLWGRQVTFAGRLTRTGGVAVAAQPVELYGRVGGTREVRLLRRITTRADGTARTALAPSRSSEFFLRFRGDAFSATSTSNHRVVQVLPGVTAQLTPAAIIKGETSVLSGQLRPALSGVTLKVLRRVGTSWQYDAAVRTASNGTYRLARSPGLGLHTYQVLLPGTSAWKSATSPAVTLRVDARDLSDGMRGDDVLALQRRLVVMKYDPGKLDGAYGYDLHHAVMAFQKVERLAVTGRWGKAERARAGRPTAWRLRYPGSGRAVEISITRQVLVLSEAGRVTRIIDVSTGTERPYTHEGRSYVAHTPRGRFTVERKIDGVRVSELGELYRPAYFFQGWAVHGSGSVPNYPASHGCVRITNPNMDRLFALLVKGTPVSLYDE